MVTNEEFIQDFVEEALTHVENIEKGILKIEKSQSNAEDINSTFRSVHSIKGTAGFFSLSKIVKLSHALESVFGEVRNKRATLIAKDINLLFAANDCLREMIKNISNSEYIDIQQHVSQMETILKNQQTVFKTNNNDTVTEILEESKEKDKISVKVSQEDDNDTDDKNIKINKLKTEDSVRVHISLLNDLLNLASEMVLGRNQLLRTVEKHKKNIPSLEPVLQNIDRITTELQEKIMQTRMQPLSNVFNKFPRVIRDISQRLGKDIQLQIEGSDVELDKSIIESITDPLTHLIRNAADHGLEGSDVRKQTGKPAKGSILLKAYHEGGQVNIDIIDDGKGIDIERIKQKVIEKGIVDKSEISNMSEQEIIQLIFKPGFSTMESVTNMSGRGVGMDVVKTNIEKLGGYIDIYTEQGKGSTFRLILPLTLAIISSLIVEACGQRYAVPQINLQEIVNIKSDNSDKRLEYINNAPVLRLRERLLPVVYLADVLNLSSTNKICKKQSSKILVLKSGPYKYGLAVENICDNEEILVKALPKFLKNCICYSGVTIMGDGDISMILDIEGIVTMSKLKFIEEDMQYAKEEDINKFGDSLKLHNLLIFQCSGPEYFAIAMSDISRIEKLNRDDIEVIGDSEYIKFMGKPLKVIRPEYYLPVKNENSNNKYLYVIILKNIKVPLGIVVDKIYDAVSVDCEISNTIEHDALHGSIIINNRIVLYVNTEQLLKITNAN